MKKTSQYLLALFALFLAIIFLAMTSCSAERMNEYHCKRCKTEDSVTVKTIEKVEYITEYMMTPADSQYTIIECDSPKIIYVSEPGKKVKQRVIVKDRIIRLDCYVNADSIAYLAKKTTIEKIKEQLKTRTIHVPKQLNKWQSFRMTFGDISLIILLIVIIGLIVYVIIRKYTKPF